jgi:maltose alpha-D-glucosyltransferase/alpha-amylase
VLEGVSQSRLESVILPEYLAKQRWFAGKSRHIKEAEIVDWADLESTNAVLALAKVHFDSGPSDTYQLPLAMVFGEAGDGSRRAVAIASIAGVTAKGSGGVLYDGVFDDKACAALLSLIENASQFNTRNGSIQGVRGQAFQEILGSTNSPLHVRRGSAEQSNTSMLFGDRFILKLFRRLEPGLNPDCEIGRYLTEKTGFDGIPPFAGSIEYLPKGKAETSTLALLQGLVANEGDGWTWATEELERYYETQASTAFPENLRVMLADSLDLSEHPASQTARDHIGPYLDSATALGRRTGLMHLALGTPTNDPAFMPEPLTADDLQNQFDDSRHHAAGIFNLLKESVSRLPDDVIEVAASVLSRRGRILNYLSSVKFDDLQVQKIRIHGDYHLGQVLRVKTDFIILDFEGEPVRSLAYRRSKQCPLKDVAGMLRSFSYAAHGTLLNYTSRHPGDATRLQPWAQLWERLVAAEFLRAYRETARDAKFLPANPGDFRKMLDVFLLDKALYEIFYELNSRPGWVRIPMLGLLSLPL